MAKHLDLSAIPPSFSTTIDPDFGIVQDLSDSGVLHRRGLFGATYYLITLSWNVLTVAQRQMLEWFFTEEAKLEPITFTLDGDDYTAELIAGPTRRYITGTLYGLTVTVRGTRQAPSQPGAYVAAPTAVSPSFGTTEPTLEASAFAVVGGTDLHSFSHFRIYDLAGALVHESGVIPATVTYTVPAGVLAEGTEYQWTVQYQGSRLGWGGTSVRTSYTTQTTLVASGALAGNTTLTRSTTGTYWGL